MTIEELLQPRIKVIAPYPDMDCNVGDIIEPPSIEWIYSDGEYCNEDYFKSWPHLFERLPWYAERNPEDLPKYVKDSQTVYKVHHYRDDSFYYRKNESDTLNLRCGLNKTLLPATEADYQAYINKQP